MFALASSHISRRVFWLVLWRAKKPLQLTLPWISRSSHYTSHICAARKTHSELLGTSRVPWCGQSKNPDGYTYIRIQECNLGHINQQLSTTKKTLADPTYAALLCKQPEPGPGHQRGEAAPTREKNQQCLTHSSAVEVEGKRKTTTGCCFLMLFTSQQRKHCCGTQG